MNFFLVSTVSGSLLCSLCANQARAEELPGGRTIDSKTHFFGDGTNENRPAASPKVESAPLEVRFEARENSADVVLGVHQRDVTNRWTLQLNGRTIDELKQNKEPKVFYYFVPPKTLKGGENILKFLSSLRSNGAAIGPILLYDQTLRDLFHLQSVTVRVTDTQTGKPVPARVTITNPADESVELFYAQSPQTAVRHGLLYTTGVDTHLELPEGDYVFYATRGMEWSRDRKTISLRGNKPADLNLNIRREVDTTGFIAADTHIHTLTFSGHGDASIQERMVTLAGEGVEMAVATDHNHNTDYISYQEQVQLNKFFTPVTGNEVTTALGHMNGFPLNPKDSPPSHTLTNWVQLVDGIRAKGAKVVILNHPRWPTMASCPYTKFGLNRASGDFANGSSFPFDGMELANALVPQPDPLYLFRDWFALMNHGEKITGIAASDSHTVGEPVGQGRSYVPSSTDDPARIDVDDACGHFLRGETCIALGIFADVRVNDRYQMGQMLTVKNGSVDVRLRVAASSWVTPRRALVFLNGQQVAGKSVPTSAGKPTDTWLTFSIPTPKYDAYLVCVVLGDGVSHPSWRTAEKFTLAATNPVFLDNDGDGKYSSPRETAQTILSRARNKFDEQWNAATKADDVIAVQMISLMRHVATNKDRDDLDHHLREAASQRPLLQEYVRYALPELKAEAR